MKSVKAPKPKNISEMTFSLLEKCLHCNKGSRASLEEIETMLSALLTDLKVKKTEIIKDVLVETKRNERATISHYQKVKDERRKKLGSLYVKQESDQKKQPELKIETKI